MMKRIKFYYAFYITDIIMYPVQKWSYSSSVYGQRTKLGVGIFNNGKNYFIKNNITFIKFLQESFQLGIYFSC